MSTKIEWADLQREFAGKEDYVSPHTHRGRRLKVESVRQRALSVIDDWALTDHSGRGAVVLSLRLGWPTEIVRAIETAGLRIVEAGKPAP